MEKKWIIFYAVCFIAGCFLGIAIAGPTDPTTFGNLTDTTCWIGGSTGNITCIGNAVFGRNISSVETIHLENDIVNHKIYDNSTCVIITGDTSTFNVC